MKKSAAVDLSLVCAVAAAALAAGCGSRPTTNTKAPGASGGWESCVDQNQKVVDSQNCVDESRRPHGAGYVPFYRYYYYPSRELVPPIGSPATGGSFTRLAPGGSAGNANSGGATSSVTRGGFGSSASASAGE